jgi:hypothetical protein
MEPPVNDRLAAFVSSFAVAILALVIADYVHACRSGVIAPPSLHDDSQYLASLHSGNPRSSLAPLRLA